MCLPESLWHLYVCGASPVCALSVCRSSSTGSHMRRSKRFFHLGRETTARRTLRKLSDKRANRPYISKAYVNRRGLVQHASAGKSERYIMSAPWIAHDHDNVSFHIAFLQADAQITRISFFRCHDRLVSSISGPSIKSASRFDQPQISRRYTSSSRRWSNTIQLVGESVTDSIAATYVRQSGLRHCAISAFVSTL